MKTNTRFGFSALLLVVAIAMPAFAYEYPHSSDAIRDAYFLARSPDRESARFLSAYTHTVPEFKIESYTSNVIVETPYVQVAEEVRLRINYHAQDAVAEFFDKPKNFRIHMDIYFLRGISDSVKVNLMQNDKEISPRAIHRSSLYPASDEYYTPGTIGEHLEIECDPERIDSSSLTIKISLPDGRKAQTKFDMADLR
jgi:hypothetical protein